VAGFSYANYAEAGILSFIEDIFRFDIRIEKTVKNSQTMALLEDASNPQTNNGVGGLNIAIVSQSALLPTSGPLGTIADISDEGASLHDQISTYIVREGDSLSQIAKMFNVSVNTVIWANDIKRGGLIRVGQELVILPITGIQYTVKKGDTLKGIAKKLKGNVGEILEFNELKIKSSLAIGQIITIPNGEYSSPTLTRRYSKKRFKGNSAYSGYYIRPISGGRRTQGVHGYNGVDLAVSCGTPIVASASGKVIVSKERGWNAGAGKYVVVKHPNNTQTLYAHMSGTAVSKGWNVVKGQVIGYIGSSGLSTGCHVHFEIRGKNAPRNPF